MPISGVGLSMAATGAFITYVAISDQPPLDALRNLLKGTPTPILPAGSSGGIATDFNGGNAVNGSATGLAGAALRYVGRPYQWAHNFDPPNGGGDCSGLVYRAFHDIGYNTPRYSSWQYPVWKAVRKRQTEPLAGDILWWTGHVAIAVGNGNMVEAPTVGIPVRVVPIRKGFLALAPDYAALAAYATPTGRGKAV